MVKIKVKSEFDVQFLVESPLTTDLAELLSEVVSVYNGILRIRSAVDNLEKLAKHLDSNSAAPQDGPTVEGCSPARIELSNRQILSKVAAEAKARVSKEQLESGRCITKDLIASTEEMFRSTLSVLKLPEETAQFEWAVLESLDSGRVAGTLAEADAKLWWAGKELTQYKKLRDFLGANEKTTIIATLTSSPYRTRATDEAYRDFVLARWKQENESDPSEVEVDVSPHDTKALKNALHGLSKVNWRP